MKLRHGQMLVQIVRQSQRWTYTSAVGHEFRVTQLKESHLRFQVNTDPYFAPIPEDQDKHKDFITPDVRYEIKHTNYHEVEVSIYHSWFIDSHYSKSEFSLLGLWWKLSILLPSWIFCFSFCLLMIKITIVTLVLWNSAILFRIWIWSVEFTQVTNNAKMLLELWNMWWENPLYITFATIILFLGWNRYDIMVAYGLTVA